MDCSQVGRPPDVESTNVLISDKRWSSSTIRRLSKSAVRGMRMLHNVCDSRRFLGTIYARKMDTGIEIWNDRCLYILGCLRIQAREFAKCVLDVVGVEEVWW